MSHVDQFIRDSILAYPTSFTNSTEVLHHALCVLGNGYRWSHEGTVVEIGGDPFPLWNREKEIAGMERILDGMHLGKTSVSTKESLHRALMEDIDLNTAIVETVDERVHLRGEISHFYPISDYALLMNIPSNVTPDWAEACEEMKALAEKAGWKV
jgi:hypothetical protein